ncbi:ComF family protein [Paenibacillus sp. R14(2021)]|uniref:ComF family protein n=1 Tax=Paenibacillus sp. R14(2021) TaxID=2859228 RepID=UPI001C612F81|nr:hypothetical protein [Paenibacillus sp. R14(2021)]
MPVSEDRLLERGFNQAERLGAYLAQAALIPLHDVLRRTRHSSKQSSKTRGARLRDTLHLFQADAESLRDMLATIKKSKSASVQSHVVRLLLIDDIYTTGSTVHACARTLFESINLENPALHVEIYSLTLARS